MVTQMSTIIHVYKYKMPETMNEIFSNEIPVSENYVKVWLLLEGETEKSEHLTIVGFRLFQDRTVKTRSLRNSRKQSIELSKLFLFQEYVFDKVKQMHSAFCFYSKI